jgi:DNA-binding transcriptional MocR family regulator
MREGIGIAPGNLFTTGDKYQSCIRLSAAFWSKRVEHAIETVGRLARAMA